MPRRDNVPMAFSAASLTRWFPFLSWPRPDRALIKGEFWAGMTVGLMLVPQGVAYAALAGMPLVTGIYASLIPALVAVLFSASTRLGVGPTALTSLLIGASLTGLAEPGSAQWVAMAAWIALLSGLLQLVMGMARFGWLLNLVTSPVLSGFTQAAALLILGSQLAALTGLRSDWGALLSTPSTGLFDLTAAAFGLGSLALLILARRWRPNFPAAIVVVGAAGAMIEQTIEYLGTRVQFGVQLATFQALRHRVVEMYVAYENASGMVRRLPVLMACARSARRKAR